MAVDYYAQCGNGHKLCTTCAMCHTSGCCFYVYMCYVLAHNAAHSTSVIDLDDLIRVDPREPFMDE